jgi:hypothetical protein
LFDKHRRERRGVNYCVDPASVVSGIGVRRMFLTDGIWRGVENPSAPRMANLRHQG